MKNSQKVKKVEIWAKEWFDKRFGNSYFSAQCFVNDEFVLAIPFQNGYGFQFEFTALKELSKNNLIPPIDGHNEPAHIYKQRTNIELLCHKTENCLKRDVIQHGKSYTSYKEESN